jgi:hypothetical protein
MYFSCYEIFSYCSSVWQFSNKIKKNSYILANDDFPQIRLWHENNNLFIASSSAFEHQTQVL